MRQFFGSPSHQSLSATTSVTRLGNFLKPLPTINLLKSSTFLGNFCNDVQIYHFSSEIIFGHLLMTFSDFFCSHWSRHNVRSIHIYPSQTSSGNRFGQILPPCPKFKFFEPFLEGLFCVWQNVEPSLGNLLCFWANFHRCKWPNNLLIWSHCETSKRVNELR